MRQILIPGTGWDTESVVSGFIKIREREMAAQSMELINAFDFDSTYPFTNIFLGPSPASYGFPVIGFAGSYKQLEESWNEWMWKFCQLLSRLDAIEAYASLSCILGNYDWKFEPRLRFENPSLSDSMQGQAWGITQSPEPDFSTDPTWLDYCSDGKHRFDEKTGQWFTEGTYMVERWIKSG